MEQSDQKFVKNAAAKANLLSRMTFFWTIGIFRKGHKNKINNLEDLYEPLANDDSEKLGDRLQLNWNKQLKEKKPSLVRALMRTFWLEYTFLALYQLVTDIFIRLTQPLFLGWLLEYFAPNSTVTKNWAFFYASILISLSGIGAIFVNQFMVTSFMNGMKVRLATCSLIYRKSLKLSSTALGNTSVGKVVNLLSNDVSRFDIVSVFIHSMWIAPMLTLIVAFLLYKEVGYAGLIGMLVIGVVTPIQSYTGKLASKFRLHTALRTDERVRLMDEIINGINVIKLYAWEKSFKKLILSAREKELKVIKKSSYVRALYMTFMLFTTRSALYCTMLSIVVLGENLTASKVFVISSYFQIISTVMSQMFVRGIAELAEAFVAIRRLQNFLEYEEKETILNDDSHKKIDNAQLNARIEESRFALTMENVSCRWKTVEESMMKPDLKIENGDVSKESLKMTLNNISVEIKKGKLIGIVGHVGSGKSSFLQTILGELPVKSGKMSINGRISFASQEAWIFSGSIRQNILFGSDMNQSRYESIVKACALKKDFDSFPHGDQTLIGERGSSLSGGQKARLSLARALYRKSDIYLLDDPLSAVDAHVGKHLFEECLSHTGYLGVQKATRILVTHQVHFLKDADWLIVMKNGVIDHQGHPNELMNDVIKIVEEEAVVRRQSFSRSSSRSSSTSIVATENLLKESEIDEKAENEETSENVHEVQTNVEESSKGKVKGNVAINYLRAGGGVFRLLVVAFLFLITQCIASLSDYFVGFWTHQEEMRRYYYNISASDDENATLYENEFGERETLLESDLLIYIGGALIASLFVIAIIRSIFFYTITIGASKNLHKMAFFGIVATSMRFFDLNPSGRILNRFSKDLGSIDEWLAKCLLDACQVILMGLGSIVVTAAINPLFLIPITVLFLIFSVLRGCFLKTSKTLKRLEGIAKSPAYVHLAATINGLSTVRAFRAEKILTKEFDQHQNLHTAAWFMYVNVSQAFGFLLDILCMIFVSFVTFSFLIFDFTSTNGSNVGLAITQSLALTMMLQWGIRQSAEVMNQMMAVERVLEYRDLPSEQKEVKKSVDKTWPNQGKIQFKHVTYRYSKTAEPALRDVSFLISKGEKIGIVGRTGAGKSSLIGSLFRIAEVEGEILIDDIDTGLLSLEQLRSKISIIPQDPVLFSGSLRRNLDPFEEYPDDLLWKALEEVKLKNMSSLQALGLQTLVASGGSNFSVGQRQLVCLARAILRNNKILVLDEATANVDPETDTLIQATIREKFADYTVLTIAHRLHTVMDSDKILVMNFGRVAEFDTPLNLIDLKDGIFRSMILASGGSESKNLIAMIKKNV